MHTPHYFGKIAIFQHFLYPKGQNGLLTAAGRNDYFKGAKRKSAGLLSKTQKPGEILRTSVEIRSTIRIVPHGMVSASDSLCLFHQPSHALIAYEKSIRAGMTKNASLHRNVRLLSWFNFCVDFVPFAPFAILYFADTAGSLTAGMSVFSIVMLSSALFEIPTGIFSDRIGRRGTVILGAIANLLSTIILAIGGSFWILILSAVLAGLARSFYSGNNDALLYDSLLEIQKTDEYDRVLGKTGAMFQCALELSTLVGGAAVYFSSIQLAVGLTLIPKIGELLISFQFSEPQVHSKKSGNLFHHLSQSLAQFRTNRNLRLLTIASSIRFGLEEVLYQFRPALYELFWPRWALGFSSMLANVGAGLGYWISHRITRRFHPLTILKQEVIINRVISIPALVFPTILTPVLLSGTSVMYGIADVARNTMLQKQFTQQQRATLGSITSFTGSIFFAVFAVSLGALADHIGPAPTTLVVQLLFLPLLLIYRSFSRRETQEKVPDIAPL